MAETAAAAAPAADTSANTRPTRPDENVFKQELAKAEKAHKAAMDRFVRLTRAALPSQRPTERRLLIYVTATGNCNWNMLC